MQRPSILLLALATVAMSACGDENDSSRDSSSANGAKLASASGDCPARQKGNGLSVSSRYDVEELIESNKWRTEMFSKTCAGALQDRVPDLPEGFGVIPTVKPYLMGDDHVYLGYAELPETLISEMTGQAFVPNNMEPVFFEIRRLPDEEMQIIKDWIASNPSEYFISEVRGQTVYLVGGFGLGRTAKGDRVSTSLQAFLDNNLVLRVTHKSLYDTPGQVTISPLVERIMGEMIAADG